MALILDSRQIPAADRAQAVREIVASTIVPVEIDFPPPEPIVRGAISDVGPLRFCAIRSNATRVERTPRLARDDLTPSVFLGLQMAGSSLIVQDDKVSWPMLDALVDLALYGSLLHKRLPPHPARDCRWCRQAQTMWHTALIDPLIRHRNILATDLYDDIARAVTAQTEHLG